MLAALLAGAALATPLDDLRWEVVNDTVMGGASSGRVVVQDDDAVRFSGELVVEGGGFASARSASADLGLAGTAGLRVVLEGDGRVWQVTLRRSDVRLRAGSYRARVATQAGEQTTHLLPWSAFEATSFGRPVPDAPPLSTGLDRVDQLGLLLADGQPGPFSVTLQAAAPVDAETAQAAGAADAETRARVQASFAAAIRWGVPAFNAGRAEVCAAHYRSALESALLLGETGLSAIERAGLSEALQRGEGQGATEAAWTYRRAMDAVMGGRRAP